jgi:2-polyprenyl-3-methyl-5-hydroxy-6-metoxy-1,4-benzoquinol methylase
MPSMTQKFASTDPSLWDDVANEYEETSFHRKNGLYPANFFRYETVLEFLETQPKGKILDAGCGPGLMTRLLQKKGWDVVACDYSPGMINTSKKKAKEEGLADVYHRLDLKELSKLKQKFSIVILNGVLPYISESEEAKVFSEIHKVLAPGGYLIASHYNLYFDVYGLDKWSVETILHSLLEPSGLPQVEIEKVKSKLTESLASPDYVLDKEKTMKVEDPLRYHEKLAHFGFKEIDQVYYNFFYMPAKFEDNQDPDVREKMERKLRRDPRGLLFFRTFTSFAQSTR